MQAMFSKLLLSLLLLLPFSPSALINEKYHPLHVSTTEISFNAKEKSLEISCKIFTDDFEDALAKLYKVKTDLNKPSMHKAMDELIKKYLSTHLQYVVNERAMLATYVGFEIDMEATNIYLEITDVTALQTLNLNNTILYGLFDDQMNIVHVEKMGVRKSVRTNYPNGILNVKF